jgi:DNA polymerase
MSDSTNTASLTDRVIRFLKQQRELFGDFSVKSVDLNPIEEPAIPAPVPTPSASNGNEEYHVEPESRSEGVTEQIEPTNDEQSSEERIAACSSVEALNNLYSELIKNTNEFVFGKGSNFPKVMIIGGAPGKNDFKNGRPFKGKVGELLDKMLTAISLSKSDLYFSNILKFRPSKSELDNAEFIQLNTSFIKKEIDILQPNIVLCVGELATQTLINDSSDFDTLRGCLHTVEEQNYFATYHPAQLLLDESLKRPCWEDLKILKEQLNRH